MANFNQNYILQFIQYQSRVVKVLNISNVTQLSNFSINQSPRI